MKGETKYIIDAEGHMHGDVPCSFWAWLRQKIAALLN